MHNGGAAARGRGGVQKSRCSCSRGGCALGNTSAGGCEGSSLAERFLPLTTCVTGSAHLSSYSDLEIHICWKVDRLLRIEPPIQTLYLRSGGATTWARQGGRLYPGIVSSTEWPAEFGSTPHTWQLSSYHLMLLPELPVTPLPVPPHPQLALPLTLIFMLLGASALISLLMRSAMPGNMVVPPLSTMLEYRSCRGGEHGGYAHRRRHEAAVAVPAARALANAEH